MDDGNLDCVSPSAQACPGLMLALRRLFTLAILWLVLRDAQDLDHGYQIRTVRSPQNESLT
jgi:hypothetical protein